MEVCQDAPLYTCRACQVMFHDFRSQAQHYKCDWHIYNLKRKVADLPPVSVQEFQTRLSRHQASDKQENLYQCTACKKHFSSQKQLDNHINSKKHKDRVSKNQENGQDEPMAQVVKKQSAADRKKMEEKEIETDSEVESVDSDEWDEDTDNPTTRNTCIFCSHHSRSYVRNLKHMTEVHSFFVPDVEYCTDIRGLIEYLGSKVYVGYMCIWCCTKGKSFQSPEAAQFHMIDKGHCKMLHEGENLIEYEDFYDYSSSYPDAATADPDEEVDIATLDGNEYQLVLPSGAVIGHRSLMRYYKQSLNPNSAVCLKKSQKLSKVMSMYKSLGWKGNDKSSIMQKVRDIKYMHRAQARYSTKLGIKQNKLQSHFRSQIGF